MPVLALAVSLRLVGGIIIIGAIVSLIIFVFSISPTLGMFIITVLFIKWSRG